MPLLDVCSLSQTLGKKKILNGISLGADKQQTVALLGPNGAGKTTLLKTIMGLHRAPEADIDKNENCIFFDKKIINRLPVHERVERGLLYLPQHTSLFTHMSVSDNLRIIYQYHPYWKNKPLELFLEESSSWLAKTHLVSSQKQLAGVLSGGQKRKLEVVRSLLSKPKMLLLDEPFAGVDPKSIYELKQIFKDLEASGIGVVISDHHVDQLLSIAQTVYVVLGGRVVSQGSIKDVLSHQSTKESYLGSQFYDEMAQKFL